MFGIFETGPIVITIGISNLIDLRGSKAANIIQDCLNRYVHGDWGDMVESDKEMNDLALECEF